MIEAMACGTPVIAFKRGSVPEVVKDKKTGFIVKTINEMAEAIKKIDQIDRKECRKWIKEKFTAERMVSDYEKVYEKILKAK
jgi:glycosyltransferase involved in cell wall biosynthesis